MASAATTASWVSGGADQLFGGPGEDTLVGGPGDDFLEGDDGNDSLSGGDGNDTLYGGAGNDTLDGGAGVDVAKFSGVSTDYVITDLGGGMLQISGPDGVDRLVGIERLAFSNGVFGENVAPAGADSSFTLTAGTPHALAVSDFGFSDSQGDSFHAVKIDTLPASGQLTLNATAVTAGEVVSATDVQAGHLVFTPSGVGTTSFTFQVQDDGLVGWGTNEDPTPNTLTFTVPDGSGGGGVGGGGVGGGGVGGGGTGGGGGGGTGGGGSTIITSGSSGTAGPDIVQLGAAADHFSAGAGDDSVDSGAGNDWVQGNAGNDSIVAGAGDDTVLGGQGDDRIFGGDGSDQLFGDAGNDTLNGNAGSDTVHGGQGADWVLGGQGDDQLFGDAGNDILNGNLGADTCYGGDGADTIHGGQGNDVLDGGAGNDWLSGDRGNDTLIGGPGADVFYMSAGGGSDQVMDFSVADGDRVQLAPGQAYSLSQSGADTVIDLSSGDRMVLVGVQLSSLPDGWIFSA